jgi:poly-gamma-glutamate synthesis protein (capsule biosynthesis protein)
MTLANNHTYDHGKEAYNNTREALKNIGLGVGGNPLTLSSDEVLYHTIDGVKVAIVPINATFGPPIPEQFMKVLAEAAEKSDVQVVSIHWGTEYEFVATNEQRALARALVDAGADAIIGHHPHVIQNIEEYRGAPIFYSLGNCVFDQYWNTDVQEGLAVALSFMGNEIHYALIPITSVDTRSAPRPMNRVERLQFLDTLAEKSSETLNNAIKEGTIVELFVPPDEKTKHNLPHT